MALIPMQDWVVHYGFLSLVLGSVLLNGGYNRYSTIDASSGR